MFNHLIQLQKKRLVSECDNGRLSLSQNKEETEKSNECKKRKNAGTSIEMRPKDIRYRNEIGHWEMDTVVGAQGKSKQSFLVLTERKTRYEIVEILKRTYGCRSSPYS